MRISRQLLLVLLLVGVLPLVIGAAIVYAIGSRQAEELLGTRLEDSVRHAGETIAKPVRPEELRRVFEQWQCTPAVPAMRMDGAA